MLNYLRADCLRMTKERVGWLALSLVTLIIGMICYISKDAPMDRQALIKGTIKILSLFMSMSFISILNYFFGSEFDMRTINHLLSKGKNRLSLLAYKMVASTVVATLYLLFYFTVFGLFNLMWAKSQEFGTLYGILLRQYPTYLGFLFFGIFVFILFNNRQLSLIVYIVYQLAAESLFFMLLVNLFKNQSLTSYSLGGTLIAAIEEVSVSSLITVALYILVFISLSFVLFKRKELK